MHALDQIIRNRFQVLPIQSDPTDPDIQVKYNGIETKKYQVGHIYYGGDQSWFYDDKNDIPEGKKAKYTSDIDLITQNGGCGLIAASDLSLYLYLYHREKFQYKDDSEMSLLKKVNDFIHQEGAPLITVEINDTQNFYYHWVNIVGVITDNIKNCVTLRVQSWGENMKIKKVCIFIVTISAVIIVISMLNKAFYDSYHNPYNSKEEKEELSIMWNQMTLGISDFNLIKFYKTNNEEGLQISIYINQGSAWFTDETIESINQLINQTIDILNNSDNIEKYSKMNIKFSTSKIEGPAGMSCNLLKEGNRFYLDSISDHHGVLLSQLHLFKNVKKIRYEYFPQTFDDDIILPKSDMIESISIHVYGDEEFEKVKILEQKETDYKIEVIDDKK